MKTANKLSVSAIALSILVPIGNKALDTTQAVLEAKLVTVKTEAKDDSEFKDAVIMNLVERVSELEKEVKELR